MQIPKKVKVGAETYIVEIVDRIDPTKSEEDDWAGLTEHNTLNIKVRRGKQEAMEHTFLHELLHTFNGAIHDERLVESLSTGLHSFIKDNPKVFNK